MIVASVGQESSRKTNTSIDVLYPAATIPLIAFQVTVVLTETDRAHMRRVVDSFEHLVANVPCPQVPELVKIDLLELEATSRTPMIKMTGVSETIVHIKFVVATEAVPMILTFEVVAVEILAVAIFNPN